MPANQQSCPMPQLRWRAVLHWNLGYHLDLADKIGLFRAIHEDEIKFIGMATSLPGGFAKRLSALAKGPDHYAGQLMFLHAAKITIEIAELDDAIMIKRLRNKLIKQHQPCWNAKRKTL